MIDYDKRKFEAYQIAGVDVADFQPKHKPIISKSNRQPWKPFVGAVTIVIIIVIIILLFT